MKHNVGGWPAQFDCTEPNEVAKYMRRLQKEPQLGFAPATKDLVGGATRFSRLDFEVRPATGELLRFNNTSPDGEPLRASLHEGMPVEAGEKWLLSKWVREAPTPYGREVGIRG